MGSQSETDNMRLVSLISGGIDSPVAAYLMLAGGHDLVAVHMRNSPQAGSKKIVSLVSRIEHVSGKKVPVYIVPFHHVQEAIAANCNRRFQCVLCKRMMYRVAEKIAEREGGDGILTGDSIGQVASQTLENLLVESSAVSVPILRPLIGFDKDEAIAISRKIGTYELSIADAVSCPFVPKRPATRARLEQVTSEEGKIDVASLVAEAVGGVEVVGRGKTD
jgi:thiamine biosynthesis protein ThiI